VRVPKKKSDDASNAVPAYIVTFSDMVTLLLTFFVLLLSLAEDQDESRFARGQDSFKRAIADFGMSGILFNKDVGSQFEHPKIKYKIDKGDDEPEDRSIDLATEVFRRTIEEIEQMMKIMPSHITGAEKTLTVADIVFAEGSWTLDGKAKAYFDNFARQLQETFAGDKPVLYVVGLAAEERGEKQQWLVSARRAQAVADHLKKLLGDENRWRIYSWGAGAGGAWTGTSGTLSTETQIAIAVLTEGT